MHRLFRSFCFLAVLCPISLLALQDELPPLPKKDAKVCVAIVANASTRSAFVERMTGRLTKNLKDDHLNVVPMVSRTTTGHQLTLARENGEEAQEKDCDYVLLTQIVDPRAHPFDPQMPQINIGGREPSVDAGDPPGSDAGPELQVNFALFRIGRLKPVLDTLIQAPSSSTVSDNLLSAMDREANRVSHELQKK